jgi:hypothetical protein
MTTTRVRSGFSARQLADALGPLSVLSGKWVGRGFNLISLPAFDKSPPSDGPRPFRVLLSATQETLEFTPGIEAPDRGAEIPNTSPPQGQNDIDLVGLRYLQTISDANSGDPLHVEPGFWLNVPGSTIPNVGPSIVRQGSIPHGACILAIGEGSMSATGKPDFVTGAPKSLPTPVPGAPPLGFGYVDPFAVAPLPPQFTNKLIIDSPNLVLEQDFAGYGVGVHETTVLSVSTAAGGGVLNIPFLQNAVNNNAAATSVTATFWVESGISPLRKPFWVLQYSQCVVLTFQNINWPHITVATLHKQ